jgi:hypothetical protein
MADSNGTIELKKVVEKALFEFEFRKEEYKRLFEIAIDGLRNFNMLHFNSVNIVKIPMTRYGTIDFPSDYIGFVAIGIPKDGKIWTFTHDGSLIKTKSIINGLVDNDEEDGEGVEITGEIIDGYNATGGVNDYYYTIDEKNRRIIINGEWKEVVLYYLSSGLNLDGTTYVPAFAINALVAYIAYKGVMNKMNVPQVLKETYHQNFRSELYQMRAFINAPDLEILRDTICKNMKQTVKR